MSKLYIPHITELATSDLSTGLVRTRYGFADLVYPELHRGAVVSMPFSLGATGGKSLDVSGYGNHGTLTNGPVWQGQNGVSFDSIDDYVNIPLSDGITTAITVSGWLRPLAWQGKYLPMITEELSGGTVVCMISSGFYVEGIWQAGFYDSSLSANWYVTSQLGGTVAWGEWTHVAVSYDGETQRLYVNGELNNSSTHSQPLPSQNSKWYVCRRHDGADYQDGNADDVRIYNRALSAEAAQIHDLGRPGITGGIYQCRLRPRVFAVSSTRTRDWYWMGRAL